MLAQFRTANFVCFYLLIPQMIWCSRDALLNPTLDIIQNLVQILPDELVRFSAVCQLSELGVQLCVEQLLTLPIIQTATQKAKTVRKQICSKP